MAGDFNLHDPAFLRSLERLSLVSKRAQLGVLRGDRRGTRRGVSVEFADHRDYVPGDDLRYLDWNVYGRLDRLLLKLFVEEEDLRVYLLVDRSRSMQFGTPTKFDHARRLGAALGYLGLLGLDRVVVSAFGDGLDRGLPPLRGRGSVFRLFDYLTVLQPAGVTALGPALRRFAHEHRHPGLCVVISDFLDPDGYEAGLRALQARRFEVVALQILAAEELAPTVVGDLKLVDAESGEAREITVGEALLRRYRERARGYCEGLRRYCLGRGMGYLLTTTDEPLEGLVQASLRRLGLVR
ncbi:MAG: DUF58 domain-containing protein [Armatimonadetes bacterium]|nr:DUF58 domain-containing protein [Armatimonadota bacterium]